MKTGSLQTQAQAVKFLNAENGVRKVICDSLCKGLQLERLGLGRGRWRLRYVNNRARRQCHTLGDAPALTLSNARELANKLRAQIALGNDPAAEKKVVKTIPTLEEFALERYLPYVKGYKKSWPSDVSYLNNQILPALGKKHLDELTRKDIIDFHHGLKAKGYKPGTCNRSLILLRYALNLAIKWETPGIKTNPTKDIQLLPDPHGQRERFLTQAETERLFAAVQRSQNAMLKYIVPALILTGCRKNELLNAQWTDFDLVRRQWRIQTTKAGKPRHVPISEGFANLLSTIPRTDSPYVFANPKTLKPYVSIFNGWNTARKQAGLAEVRIHDLRHSFASFLINGGRSIYEIQKILGHSQIKTSQRYAHLSQDTLLDAANIVGDLIAKVPPAQLGYINV